MASLAKEILELIAALEGLRLSIYIDTASCALFVYDYILTFEHERTFMWPKKWSLLKVLFFMVRYLPILDLSITATHHFRTDLSPEACSFAFKSAAWLINLGIITAELILIIRTHAVWGRTRSILVVLIVWGLANLIPDVLILGFFLKSIGFSALPPGLSGCLVTSGNSLLRWVWIILMVYEAGIVALLFRKGLQMYEGLGRTSSLYKAFFGDGAIFYVYIFTLSVANVIVISVLSRDKSKLGMLASLERVTHSVLTCRLLLSLHKATAEPKQEDVENLESMRFEMRPRRADDSEGGVDTLISSVHTARIS